MSKYSEMVEIYESKELDTQKIENSFNEAFRIGFSTFLGCQPESVDSKKTEGPTKGMAPIILYRFNVSLDIISENFKTKTLSTPIRVLRVPGKTDVSKFAVYIGSEKEGQPGKLGDELYERIHDLFKKKLSEPSS